MKYGFGFNQIALHYRLSESEDNCGPTRITMSSVAILVCQTNSHPFQERRISLHEPVKIGRSVARARPAANNGIFDCKVLSRNHAMLWYENGKVSGVVETGSELLTLRAYCDLLLKTTMK